MPDESKDQSLSSNKSSQTEKLNHHQEVLEAKYKYSLIKLKLTETRFRLITDHMQEVLWIRDLEQDKIVFINPAYERIWGRSCESLYTSPSSWIEAIHPKDLEQVQKAVLALQQGENFDEEYRIVRPDGEIRWIHDKTFPYRNKAGKIYQIIGLARDITTDKMAKGDLKKGERDPAYGRGEHRQDQILFDAIQNGIIITEMSSNQIQYVNSATCQMLGYVKEELLGQDITRLYPKTVLPEIVELFKPHSASRTSSTLLPCLKKDGAILYVNLYMIPSIIDGKFCWINFFRDVKEHNWAEEEHKKTKEEFQQAQKFEALGRLASNISHDFNNLLTIISGYSEMLTHQLDANDAPYRFASQIRKASKRANALTQQLLAFSRKQIIQPKVIDLSYALIEMEDMLRRLVSEHIELKFDFGEFLAPIKIDPTQLMQILMNLVINAKDAMPKGGILTLATQNIEVNQNKTHLIKNLTVKSGRYTMLSVTDTGFGMDQETQLHIFEPFFTTKMDHGTGLGLATVYGIVKQGEGYIDVWSEVGKGTIFKIYFPSVRDPVEKNGIDVPRPKPTPRTETILLVEDEAMVKTVACDVLRVTGYTVFEASNGEEALTLCQKHPDKKIDLVITDVIMPKMNGFDLVKQLKILHPQIKVLYISGYTDSAIYRQGEIDGPILKKPFMPEVFHKKICKILDANCDCKD